MRANALVASVVEEGMHLQPRLTSAAEAERRSLMIKMEGLTLSDAKDSRTLA